MVQVFVQDKKALNHETITTMGARKLKRKREADPAGEEGETRHKGSRGMSR